MSLRHWHTTIYLADACEHAGESYSPEKCPQCELQSARVEIEQLREHLRWFTDEGRYDSSVTEYAKMFLNQSVPTKDCRNPWHKSDMVAGPCHDCGMTVEQFNTELGK